MSSLPSTWELPYRRLFQLSLLHRNHLENKIKRELSINLTKCVKTETVIWNCGSVSVQISWHILQKIPNVKNDPKFHIIDSKTLMRSNQCSIKFFEMRERKGTWKRVEKLISNYMGKCETAPNLTQKEWVNSFPHLKKKSQLWKILKFNINRHWRPNEIRPMFHPVLAFIVKSTWKHIKTSQLISLILKVIFKITFKNLYYYYEM